MKTSNKFRLFGLSLLMVAGLPACDKPGSAENAGKSIDQTMERAGQKIDQAGKQIDQAVDSAGKKVGDAADRVGEKLGEQGVKAGVAMDDTEITTKVKAAIFAEQGLQTLQISVDTVNGVVTLTGSVDALPNSQRAQGLAGAVAGVKRVENRLALKLPG